MRKSVRIAILTIFAVIAIILAVQISRFGVYHDGRCGTQKWERKLLWMDYSLTNYDEFGIVERWTLSHTVPCEPIWISGPLGPGVSEYWPSLHFSIAVGTPVADIETELSSATASALRSKDALGRTVLHWAAIYPDREGREELIGILVGKGLSLQDRDNDGLTPADWRRQYERFVQSGAE